MPTITPCLWFDTEGEEAATFYVSLFDNSRITDVSYYGEGGPRPAGTALTVAFELDGRPFLALNGGPQYHFTEAISMSVDCPTQADADRYWDALVDGGEPGQCGWLKDRFGLSWQIVPSELPSLLGDPDPERAQRAMQAMLSMSKLDIDAIRHAADAA
ncbi:MAG: VOC family protein [Acidimicrobiales bacterium]|nr:VOC family protein [Acidimicrobiales bacterium]